MTHMFPLVRWLVLKAWNCWNSSWTFVWQRTHDSNAIQTGSKSVRQNLGVQNFWENKAKRIEKTKKYFFLTWQLDLSSPGKPSLCLRQGINLSNIFVIHYTRASAKRLNLWFQQHHGQLGPCRWTAVVDADRVPPYSCARLAKIHLVKCSKKKHLGGLPVSVRWVQLGAERWWDILFGLGWWQCSCPSLSTVLWRRHRDEMTHATLFKAHAQTDLRQMIRHDSAYGIFLPLAQCFCFIFASLTEGKERPWMFWSHLDVRYALLGDALLKRLTDTRAAANGKKE